MSGDEVAEALAAIEAVLDERAERIRRGWYWLAAAVGCCLGFLAAILSAVCLDWFPWWLMTIAVVLEVGTFVCLVVPGRRR